MEEVPYFKSIAQNSNTISLLMCCALMLVFIAAFFPSALIVDNELGLKPEHILSAIISVLMFLTSVISILIANKSYLISKQANDLSEKVFQSQAEQLQSQEFYQLYERFEKRIKKIEEEMKVNIYTEGLILEYLSAGRFIRGKYQPSNQEVEEIKSHNQILQVFYKDIIQRGHDVRNKTKGKQLTESWINQTFVDLSILGPKDPVFDSFLKIPEEDLISIQGGARICTKKDNPLYYAKVHRQIIASLLITMNREDLVSQSEGFRISNEFLSDISKLILKNNNA